MTLVDKVHEVFMSYKGRSPRQIYADSCARIGIKPNRLLLSSLSDVVDEFFRDEVMSFAPNYFGPKGCLAIMPLVECQQRLKSIDLSSCGADDGVAHRLFEVLQDHPRLRSVNLSNNPLITVWSAKYIIYVCRQNRNIIDVKLDNTGIGRGVRTAIHKVCDNNQTHMENFFPDNVFALKDMFLGLDVDGSGWVNINTFVASVNVPMVQEKLKDRISIIRPKKRDDHCIDFNTFLDLVCRSYKSKEEIAKQCESECDPVREMITSNWLSLMSALSSSGVACSGLSKVRPRGQIIPFAAAQRIATAAIESTKKRNDGSGAVAADIGARELWEAWRAAYPAAPRLQHRPSMFDPAPTVKWKLPPILVKEFVALFEKSASKRGRLPVTTFLSMRIHCDIEFLLVDFLRGMFARFSIPVEDSDLSLEEATTILDEFYDLIRVDKNISLEQLKSIAVA